MGSRNVPRLPREKHVRPGLGTIVLLQHKGGRGAETHDIKGFTV